MALGSVLVDRARVVERVAAAAKVEGRTPMVPVTGAWFRARLFLPMTREEEAASRPSHKRSVKVPTLLYGIRDLEGEPITLREDTKVQVNSGLDVGVYEVTGIEVIRKKGRNSILCHQAQLRRVADREFVPVDV